MQLNTIRGGGVPSACSCLGTNDYAEPPVGGIVKRGDRYNVIN